MNITQPQISTEERHALAVKGGLPRRHIEKIITGEPMYEQSKSCYDTIYPLLRDRNSVLVRGGFGSGKTHMASVIGFEWPGTGRGGVIYQTVCGLLNEIKSSYSNRTTGAGPMERATKCGLLILDELLANHGSAFDQSTIRELIDSRYRNMKATIIMTNLSNDGLVQALDQPTIDRMFDGGCVVTLKGKSQRAGAAV